MRVDLELHEERRERRVLRPARGTAASGNMASRSRELLHCTALQCIPPLERHEAASISGSTGGGRLGERGGPELVEVEALVVEHRLHRALRVYERYE